VKVAPLFRPTMADIFTQKKRSAVMSAIHSRGNAATELRLDRRLSRPRHHRLAPRRDASLAGRRYETKGLSRKARLRFPARASLAVFVDGCFWHGCALHATQPKTNAAFWRKEDLPPAAPATASSPSPSVPGAGPSSASGNTSSSPPKPAASSPPPPAPFPCAASALSYFSLMHERIVTDPSICSG